MKIQFIFQSVGDYTSVEILQVVQEANESVILVSLPFLLIRIVLELFSLVRISLIFKA